MELSVHVDTPTERDSVLDIRWVMIECENVCVLARAGIPIIMLEG